MITTITRVQPLARIAPPPWPTKAVEPFLQDGQVTFRWKDYTQANYPSLMTLQATEFIRRFLLHVLPSGFVKIRHFGFLVNRRWENIQLCRTLLGSESPNFSAGAVTKQQPPNPVDRCPLCNVGRMRPVEILCPRVAILSWRALPFLVGVPGWLTP
jgi:hypothetical protein